MLCAVLCAVLQGADVIRDIEFVVFDEVHYVNDAERGVVSQLPVLHTNITHRLIQRQTHLARWAFIAQGSQATVISDRTCCSMPAIVAAQSMSLCAPTPTPTLTLFHLFVCFPRRCGRR